MAVDDLSRRLKVPADKLLQHEVLLLQGIMFQLLVYHPFRPLQGFLWDMADSLGYDISSASSCYLFLNTSSALGSILLRSRNKLIPNSTTQCRPTCLSSTPPPSSPSQPSPKWPKRPPTNQSPSTSLPLSASTPTMPSRPFTRLWRPWKGLGDLSLLRPSEPLITRSPPLFIYISTFLFSIPPPPLSLFFLFTCYAVEAVCCPRT